MHELPITQSVLDIALRHAEQHDATKITDIYLVVGQLSSFVDDSIQYYWDIISAGTIAVGASLHFQRIPAEMTCIDCGHSYTLSGDDLACPKCESINVQVTSGEQLYVEAIDVETE